MTVQNLKLINSDESSDESSDDELDKNFDIPLNMDDILYICREYSKLGWSIQNQIEIILSDDIESSIANGSLKRESLPHIKGFLQQIIDNPYFGEAIDQATDCFFLIEEYELKHELVDSQIN